MSIQLRDVTYTYGEGLPDETRALKGIGFDVYDGEFLSIIGHTGSGKSTLLQHLNGLLQPSGGTILIDGKDITDPAVVLKDVRQNVGLVFQYPEYQLFEDTVAADVAFGPKNLGLSEEEIDARVRESLALVDLDYDEIANRSPFDLSGGQKRRVAIAGVLAMRPHVLVLDEPMAGLDPESHQDILRMIDNIHQDKKRIIIFVSHNMRDVERLSDRVVVMDRGEVISVDTPDRIFSKRSMLAAAGLDVPPVSGFLHRLKEDGLGVHPNVFDAESAADEILRALGKAPGAAEESSGAEASPEAPDDPDGLKEGDLDD